MAAVLRPGPSSDVSAAVLTRPAAHGSPQQDGCGHLRAALVNGTFPPAAATAGTDRLLSTATMTTAHARMPLRRLDVITCPPLGKLLCAIRVLFARASRRCHSPFSRRYSTALSGVPVNIRRLDLAARVVTYADA